MVEWGLRLLKLRKQQERGGISPVDPITLAREFDYKLNLPSNNATNLQWIIMRIN